MKKLHSLFSVFAIAAILGISTLSAQKTVLTVEKLWSISEPSAGTARQGFGMDGALYYHKQGDGVYKVNGKDAVPELVISKTTSGIAAHAVAKDDAGNIIIFGSAKFPTDAVSENFIYVQKKGDTIGAQITCPTLEGFDRTDFIAASGNVFSEEGGCLYLMNNNGKNAFKLNITNGTTISVHQLTDMNLGSYQNTVMCVHNDKFDGTFHYAAAGKGIYVYNETCSIVEGLTDLNTQCLGATHFTLADKELWAYHVGSNYTSQFKILNKTDNSFITDKNGAVELFINDPTKVAAGGALRGIWMNAEKIDDNNYMLYAWHSHDGGAVYKVSAVIAAEVTLDVNDDAMGSVEGAGDIAIGTNATVKAIPNLGHSFACWKNGDEIVSTDAEYTFLVTKNMTLTATFQKEENKTLVLAINDSYKGDITLSAGITLGENSITYGQQVTLTAVPLDEDYYTFVGWYDGETLYATDYTIKVIVTEDLSLTAKFASVLNLTYELNGGITNDYGWTSKGDLLLDIQNDFGMTETYGMLYVVKEMHGIYYFRIGNKWMSETEAQGQSAIADGFFQHQTYTTNQKLTWILEANQEKYGFLINLIDYFRFTALNGRDSLINMSEGETDACLRGDISGFMLCSPANEGYPYTCDWTKCGQPEAYIPVWKHAFANPTEIRTTVTLNAPYKEGYTFVGWYATPDFSSEKITMVTPESVIDGGTLYAKWEESPKATLTLTTNQLNMGTINGPTETYINTLITLQANANYGYEFVQWTDGNLDNPRAIVLTQDTTFTAEFKEKMVEITTASHNIECGTTQGDTIVAVNKPITITALANYGYHFVNWECDGEYYENNPLSIITVDQNKNYIAHFEKNTYHVVCEYNENSGWVEGSGDYKYLDRVILHAHPNNYNGYHFVQWSDGNTDNPREFFLTQDTTFTAEFKASCGDNLYWEYGNYSLSIVGNGDMYDYTSWTSPWKQHAHTIQDVELPEGMTSIGTSAFADCRFLESVTIPATVYEIRYSAFENCRMLSTVNFAKESALTTIGNWAFYNCHELKDVTIPEGVTEIGYAAFYGCTYMSEITLPESMQYIADNGFALCSKLRRMNVAASTPPTVAARTFEDVDRSIPVYVPTESIGLYKDAPIWKEFNIVGKDAAPTSVENTEVNSSNVQKLLRNGQLIIIRDGIEYTVIGQELERLGN